MIPILYDSTETAFTSQGLGCLSDTISCEVTEERNGEFELELEYPIGGIHYDDIAYSRYIAVIPADGENIQPFEIYKITRPLDGVVTVYARHLSYRLGYTPVKPTTAATSAEAALNTLKSAAVVACPFTFSSDVTTEGTFTNSKLQSLRSLLGGQTGSVLDVFGGEYKFDKWNVSLLASRGSSIPVTIEYGKNLTDLEQEENIESTYTAVICIWQKDVDGVTKSQNGNIVYTANKDAFPYVRTLVVDKSMDYDEQPTVDQLTADATSYIKANNVGVPKVSIDVSFVNLRDTEEYKNVAPLQRIHLCDTIKVKFAKLGVNASAKITKTVYDALSERYTSLTIGDSRSSLAGTVVGITEEIDTKTKQASSAMQTEMERITKVMQGGLGGYVVQRMNETTGYPEETLYLDQPDLDTATNVLRINMNGIAFSTNGYKGPYKSAWTLDGAFVADFITTGTLNANLIKTGTISNSKGTISINLDEANVQFSNSNGDTCTIVGPTLLLKNGSTGAYTYITLDSIGFYKKGGTINGYYGSTMMRFGTKTSHGNKAGGTGILITKDYMTVGNNSEWGGVPVFKVGAADNGYNYVMVSSLRFYRSDGGSAGAFGWYEKGGDDWVGFNSNLRVSGHLTANDYEDNSDERLKQDIEDLPVDESRRLILSVTPRRYRFISDQDTLHHGLIAQNVLEYASDEALVHERADGYTLSYNELIADLINVVQDQHKRITDLENRIAKIEEALNADH